jgi:hypothetical protein
LNLILSSPQRIPRQGATLLNNSHIWEFSGECGSRTTISGRAIFIYNFRVAAEEPHISESFTLGERKARPMSRKSRATNQNSLMRE